MRRPRDPGAPRFTVPLTGALLVGATLVACSAGTGGGNESRLQVVTTTTVLADFVRNVGGERVEVHPLVPPGAEPHTFDPAPSDAIRIESAAVVFANGLGLDAWITELVSAAATSTPIIAVGEDLPGVDYRQAAPPEEGTDPHVWLNVAYAIGYVARIADELAAIDPSGADAYRAGAERYRAELTELDSYARGTLGSIPEANRSVVSFHEAFGYFAEAYGLTVVDTVVGAPGQDPSAGEVAALIDEIRASGVRAILAEAQFPTALVERIGEETGATVVAGLFSDSLAESQTYVEGIRTDVDAITAALR